MLTQIEKELLAIGFKIIYQESAGKTQLFRSVQAKQLQAKIKNIVEKIKGVNRAEMDTHRR